MIKTASLHVEEWVRVEDMIKAGKVGGELREYLNRCIDAAYREGMREVEAQEIHAQWKKGNL